MTLQVYNVRTRRKEPFTPKDPQRVGLYVCGLTVYDSVHIGHARTYVAFEVIRRVLEARYGAVRHVMNVTDVDDKIIARAKEAGVSPREHAATWDRACREDLERLGIRVPSGDDAPHVTTSIPDILHFIAAIVQNGFGYVTTAGNVYFDVPAYDGHAAVHLTDAEGRPCGYGSLSNRDFRDLHAGTRKDVEADKRHPADFALWKAGEPADHPDTNWNPRLETPDLVVAPGAAAGTGALAGIRPGRPGWHIECSLMSTRALGETFDLHGGGQDLIFPHHENEIAQSQAKTGKAPFVNVWMHTGFLNVEGEKMSKSLGNFITLRDALDEWDKRLGPGRAAEALRLYFLQTHYRSRIDYQSRGLEEAARALSGLGKTRQFLRHAAARGQIGCADMDVPLGAAAKRLVADVAAALDDDFHTPNALAALFDFQREANRLLDTQSPTAPLGSAAAEAGAQAMESCAALLTLTLGAAVADPEGAPPQLIEAAKQLAVPWDGTDGEASIMTGLVAARAQARLAKDWKRSDAIRAAAKDAGYLIEDTAGGQRWRRL